jgi:hypothetical protein
MTLPHDIARCPGVGSDADGWREGCDDCQRRTEPGCDYSPHMAPPPIIVFECEYRIEPSAAPRTQPQPR